MSTLAPEEVHRLIEAGSLDGWGPLWVLLVTTGLRLGEALGLQWRDLDLESGRLVVRRSVQRQQGVGLTTMPPKTERSRRTVLFGNLTANALRQQRSQQAQRHLRDGTGWQDEEFIFTGPSGKAVDPSWARDRFHKTLDAAGLRHVRLHDLRHTAATLLLQQGVNAKVVQELLGHSTVSITLNTYSHVLEPLHREAAVQMDAALGVATATVGVTSPDR
jgi:integrase